MTPERVSAPRFTPEMHQAPRAFDDVIDRSGVRHAHPARSEERGSGHDRHFVFVEQSSRETGAFVARWIILTHVREQIERAFRLDDLQGWLRAYHREHRVAASAK